VAHGADPFAEPNGFRWVLPPGLAARLRYSVCAIALALYAWAVWSRPAARVREQVIPFAIVGASEAHRWRSLRRWAGLEFPIGRDRLAICLQKWMDFTWLRPRCVSPEGCQGRTWVI